MYYKNSESSTILAIVGTYCTCVFSLAMTNTMDDRLNEMCDGDTAKVDQAVNCIEEGTGIDVTAIDRDAVRESICEQKQTCFTELVHLASALWSG